MIGTKKNKNNNGKNQQSNKNTEQPRNRNMKIFKSSVKQFVKKIVNTKVPIIIKIHSTIADNLKTHFSEKAYKYNFFTFYFIIIPVN